MRSRQAVGRPGTPVIPQQWAQAPRVVMAATMTACCTIRRPGGVKGTFDETTGTFPFTPHTPHYTGPARVQLLPVGDQVHIAGDDPVTVTSYRIVVTRDATQVQVDDVVTFTDAGPNGDPGLVGRDITVSSLERGSLDWERDLICIDNLG